MGLRSMGIWGIILGIIICLETPLIIFVITLIIKTVFDGRKEKRKKQDQEKG